MAAETYANITASAGNIEEGRIAVPPIGEHYIRTIGGTALLSENGSPRATMSFISMKKEWGNNVLKTMYADNPPMFVMNGGPSAPATLWGAQTLTGPYYVSHDLDGHLSKSFRLIGLMEAAGSPVNHTDVVHIDPVGTGIGSVCEGVDPDWAYNSETDAEAAAGFIAWYLQEFGNGKDVNLVGTSFRALQLPLMVAKLAGRGINVQGMAIMSGAYDYSLIDYSNPQNHKAFINTLPAIAIAAQYHHAPQPKYSWSRCLDNTLKTATAERLFDEAREFAENEYAQVLRADHVPAARHQAVVQKLGELTGLSRDQIETQNLRIDPYWFAANFREGKVLSGIDSRLAFDPDEVTIDPALDGWDDVYRSSFSSGDLASGYPKSFSQNYQGIIKVPQWKFNGLAADRRAHAAMLQVIEQNPRIAINAFNGMYDLNMPPPSTEKFWDEIRAQCGIRVRHLRATNVDFNDTLTRKPGVRTFLLPIGHQLISPYKYGVRQLVTDIIGGMTDFKP